MTNEVETMDQIHYEQDIPLLKHYDVLVAGSGPAGLCAAITAAREGVRVALVERYGVVGGNLTSGHVGPILGMVGSGTIRDEIMALLNLPDNDMIGITGVAHDFEHAKTVLTQLICHPNIDVYLQTTVVDAIHDNEHIEYVVCSCKEKPFALTAQVYIDATGDGDLSYIAGAEIMKGRDDGLMQPVTHEFTIDGVDESQAIVCIGDVDNVELNGVRFLTYCYECAKKGMLPANLAAVRLHRTSRPGQRQVNTTQANGIDSTNVSDLFTAEVTLRNQIELLIKFFRDNLPGYENCYCVSSGTTLGVRESRRVKGLYMLTGDDCANGAHFEDVVVHNAEFIVDIHNPEGAGQAEKTIQYVKPYDIPYRCFVPKGFTNLYTAGRCISGTHRAHASYRVMSICMAMGEAVGTAASICCKTNCLTNELNIKVLQNRLVEKGIDLFS